jgi:hypothetical protein
VVRGRGSFLSDERARAAVIEAHLYTRLAAERLALNPIQELTREAKRFPEEGARVLGKQVGRTTFETYCAKEIPNDAICRPPAHN